MTTTTTMRPPFALRRISATAIRRFEGANRSDNRRDRYFPAECQLNGPFRGRALLNRRRFELPIVDSAVNAGTMSTPRPRAAGPSRWARGEFNISRMHKRAARSVSGFNVRARVSILTRRCCR